MKQTTLCFLIKERGKEKEILLAMKKRGWGQGKWNGVGGKLDVSRGDKDIFDAAIREMKEEIGVEIEKQEEMAILDFSYPYLSNPDEKEWRVRVFFASDWQGTPEESEEMKPQWFKINEIPFDNMWPDDKFWLPRVLNGERLKAKFIFKAGEIIDSYEIKNTQIRLKIKTERGINE